MNILSHNLVWTSQLGEAYHNQHSAMMAAVQALRAKAKTAEHIKSSPQLTLAQPSGDMITLQPGNSSGGICPAIQSGASLWTPLQTAEFQQ